MKNLKIFLLVLVFFSCNKETTWEDIGLKTPENSIEKNKIHIEKNKIHIENFKNVLLPSIKSVSQFTELFTSRKVELGVNVLTRNCPTVIELTDPLGSIYEMDFGMECIVGSDIISGICTIETDALFGNSDGAISSSEDFEINEIGIVANVALQFDNASLYNITEGNFIISDGGFSSDINLDAIGTLEYVDVNNNGTNPISSDGDYQIINENGNLTLDQTGVTYLFELIDLSISESSCGDYCPFDGSIKVLDENENELFTAIFGGGTGTCGERIEIKFTDGSPTIFIDCQI